MKKLVLIIAIIISATKLSFAIEPGIDNAKSISVYDICDVFVSDKPIFSYDMLFGAEIKASTMFALDNRYNCMEFEYKFNNRQRLIEKKIFHIYTAISELRKYSYESNGQLSEIINQRDDYRKTLKFFYDDKGRIIEIREYIESENTLEVPFLYDYITYRFNKKGNIIEVRGINKYMLGFKQRSEILKIYDYDEQNKLKAIRDFKKPDENKILSYDEFVQFGR